MSTKGLNRVTLLGHIGKEPKVQIQNDMHFVNFSLATSDIWKDKTTGERKEHTEWHRVSLFGKLAEIGSKYLHKGSKILIEGSLRTKKYTDNQGIERHSTAIIAKNLQILDKKPQEEKQNQKSEEEEEWEDEENVPF